MNVFSMRRNTAFKRLCAILLLLASTFLLFAFSSCNRETDYFSYVSEYRNNVLCVENETIDLKVYSIEREYPYAADGVKRQTSPICEVFFSAPSGDEKYEISFHYDGKEYGGECSYDAVKSRYYYSCSADLSKAQALAIQIKKGEELQTLNAVSVLKEDTLTGAEMVKKIAEKEKDLFKSLTENDRFHGELFVRVLYEEKVYYYIGVVAENGKIYSFLMDGTSGNVIAKRQN